MWQDFQYRKQVPLAKFLKAQMRTNEKQISHIYTPWVAIQASRYACGPFY